MPDSISKMDASSSGATRRKVLIVDDEESMRLILGLEPSEVMLVAAHKDDLRAAQACGLATAFVKRPREKGPKVKVDVTPEPSFDYNARDFVDLAARISR